MPFPPKNAALVIIGHGSTLNPDSSVPTHSHGDVIRKRGLFAEVHCAFWKEEPSMREVFYAVKSDIVYVVPNFISEGYFTRQVLPRELGLEGEVTKKDGKTVFYCDPVGIHPSMTRLILHRADDVANGVPRDQTTLIIVGHGTSLNENSRKAIETQAQFIRDGGHGFAEVLDAYMEEAPFVAKWHELASSPNVVVVPFFIADGLHSYQDIPVLLGIEPEPTAAASQHEVFRRNPHELHGKRLYYSTAVGTDALMAGVILDQVRDFETERGAAFEPSGGQQDRLPFPKRFIIGQIKVVRQAGGGWLLHHKEDGAGAETLRIRSKPRAAREIAMYDAQGHFRPLKSAPTLRQGWLLRLADDEELRLALDFFYPAALGMWESQQAGTLKPVTLRETLGRQTGMYRFANTLTDEQAQQLISCGCEAKTKCLRRITWELSAGQPLTELAPDKLPFVEAPSDEIPVLCVEACTHIVSAARERAREISSPRLTEAKE